MLNFLLKHKYLLLLIPIGIAPLFFVDWGCERKVTIPKTIDKVKVSIDSVAHAVSDQKQRSNADTVIIHHYHTKYVDVYHEVIKESPDTCHEYINRLYAISNANDSLYGNHILRQDSIINGLEFEALQYIFEAIQDSIKYSKLHDSIPKLKRKAFIKGFIRGAVLGGAIVEGFNIWSRIKP